MLLNEFLKEHEQLDEQRNETAELRKLVEAMQAKLSEQ